MAVIALLLRGWMVQMERDKAEPRVLADNH